MGWQIPAQPAEAGVDEYALSTGTKLVYVARGNDNRFMIQCSQGLKWFHGDGVNVVQAGA